MRKRLVRAAEARSWTGMSSRQVHAAIRREVLAEPEFAWATEPLETPGINYLGLALLGIVLLPVLPFFILWAVYMQLFHELRDEPGTTTTNAVPDPLIEGNVRVEDHSYQNQFSQIMLMKPGRARLWTLNALFL